jgi:type VI secretion system protein
MPAAPVPIPDIMPAAPVPIPDIMPVAPITEPVNQFSHQQVQNEIPEQSQRAILPSGNLMQAFLNGAGLDTDIKLSVSEEQLMTELGGLFKKITLGLIGVLAARGDIKSEFRLSQTMIRPIENNPLKFSLNVDEAMLALINKRGRGYMTADAAFDEAFNDIQAHQIAVLSGMQSALQGVLQRFEPAKIEAGNKHASSMKKMLGGQKSKFWDDFVSLYANVRSEAEEDFQNVFGREFAKAYDQQIQKQKDNS